MQAEASEEKMVALLTLRNTKMATAIEKLIPLTKRGVESDALRPHIIYTLQLLSDTNRDKLITTIMPIILNQTEATEIRIASVTVLFESQPNYLELEQLITAMDSEKNLQVANFIVTAFKV